MAEHTERGADRRQGDRRQRARVADALEWYKLGIASRRRGERRQRERRTGIEVEWLEAEEVWMVHRA